MPSVELEFAPEATHRRESSAEAGQGMAEYALILTFVAAVVVGALTVLGTNVNSFFGTLPGKF